MKKIRHRDMGYTLIELLVATVLGGFLVMGIAETLRFTGRADAVLHRVVSDAQSERAASAVITRLIGTMVPVFSSGGLSDRVISFAGEPNEIRFVGRLPEAIGSDELANERLGVVDSPANRHLELSWALNLPTAQQGGDPIISTSDLLDHVEALRFRYFGADGGGLEPTWHDRWVGRSSLPGLVEVEFRVDSGRGQTLHTLFIKTLLTASPECRYDPEGYACRHVR